MTIKLAEGSYPFAKERHDLADMAMVEAAPALEAFFRQQAATNGVEFIRDEPVELKCKLEPVVIYLAHLSPTLSIYLEIMQIRGAQVGVTFK